MLTGGTFNLSDGNCDGQNGFRTHFACQRIICYIDMTVMVGVNRPYYQTVKPSRLTM